MEIEELINRPKSLLSRPEWKSRSNHAGHLIAVADLIDGQRITIPGVTLQLELKAPVITDSCLYLFSIMRLAGKQRRPIYQLEVTPAARRSHNGIPAIYGPHEHVGDNEPVAVVHPDVHCGSWPGSLKWFLLRSSIAPFDIEDPQNVQL